jgi:CRP/FNR family cyclic AMP-dependent transcriptional regulator
VWYLDQGKVKLAVRFHQGKEAIVTILDAEEFFGEECLAGQPLRLSTAIAMGDCARYRQVPDGGLYRLHAKRRVDG